MRRRFWRKEEWTTGELTVNTGSHVRAFCPGGWGIRREHWAVKTTHHCPNHAYNDRRAELEKKLAQCKAYNFVINHFILIYIPLKWDQRNNELKILSGGSFGWEEGGGCVGGGARGWMWAVVRVLAFVLDSGFIDDYSTMRNK